MMVSVSVADSNLNPNHALPNIDPRKKELLLSRMTRNGQVRRPRVANKCDTVKGTKLNLTHYNALHVARVSR